MPAPAQLEALRRRLPAPVKRLGKKLLGRDGLWNHPHLKKQGVIHDLYYWVADGRLDTLLPLQNYFSVFFPDRDTATTGTLYFYDRRGKPLGTKSVALGAHVLLKLRVSEVLRELGITVSEGEGYGTLLWDLRIPEAVQQMLDPREPFYFWDRFYIAYLSADNQPCFVHGVDKSYVANIRARGLDVFYPAGKRYTWVPEIPVNLNLYRRFSVIMWNRTRGPSFMTLTVADDRDVQRRWSAQLPPFGVHRFELDQDNTEGLARENVRLLVDGISSRWGRPVVFKEFHNGAISAMHC